MIQSSNVQRDRSQRMTVGARLSDEQLQFAKEAARQLQTPYNCAQLEQIFENIIEVHCFPIADQFKINFGRRYINHFSRIQNENES